MSCCFRRASVLEGCSKHVARQLLRNQHQHFHRTAELRDNVRCVWTMYARYHYIALIRLTQDLRDFGDLCNTDRSQRSTRLILYRAARCAD